MYRLRCGVEKTVYIRQERSFNPQIRGERWRKRCTLLHYSLLRVQADTACRLYYYSHAFLLLNQNSLLLHHQSIHLTDCESQSVLSASLIHSFLIHDSLKVLQNQSVCL